MLLKLAVDHAKVAGELRNFPVLVAVRHAALRGQSGVHFLADDGALLACEILSYDPAEGSLRAWVRVPLLSGTQDTMLQIEAGDGVAGVWGDYRLVLHEPSVERIAYDPRFKFTDALTVEAWVDTPEAHAEALQSLVSKWKSREDFGAFTARDVSRTEGLDTTGFFGGVFDGRYLYFTPQYDAENRHGKVLRYDTHGDFHAAGSWSAYDASHTSGLTCKGYYGAAFDGRYVIFPPRRDPHGFHSHALRYDTRGEFHDPASWSAYAVGVDNSSQSATFDGRYLYFNPGQRAERRDPQAVDDASPKVTGMAADQVLIASGNFMRYDTQGAFDDPASWTTYDVSESCGADLRDFDGACFDGRYIYCAPLAYAVALRYDTRGEFRDPASWQTYDCGARFGMKRNVGVIFDGQHVYFVPYGECPVAVRFDTTRDFSDDAAWQAYELSRTPGLVLGYDGACFDGRYIYYIPYYDEGSVAHGVMLRYDTQGDFTDPASWATHDATWTDGLFTGGFNGGASDGRYLYCIPWLKDSQFVPGRIGGGGNVLRYDTTGAQASFDLRFCDLGHNGGLCAALPGPRFLINTEDGPRSVAANQAPPAGRHHFAGVYDGQTISLYIDGQLINSSPASGQLVNNDIDLALGRVLDGAGKFSGTIHEVRISAVARSAAWLATEVANLAEPEGFCRVVASN